ncbi:MAG: hypothetical protein LC798_03220 [Chloroflexi bacterium]|nr:hypothetical protein [Chloroflexota bacterium]
MSALTFQGGDEQKVRGDAEVSVYRASSAVRAAALLAAGWVQRVEGDDGLGMWDQPRRGLRLIHSIAREDDGEVWVHLSLSRRDRKLPTWEQVCDVKQMLYPDRVAVQVLPPRDEWYSWAEIHHLWICLTARPTPDFRSKSQGSI